MCCRTKHSTSSPTEFEYIPFVWHLFLLAYKLSHHTQCSVCEEMETQMRDDQPKTTRIHNMQHTFLDLHDDNTALDAEHLLCAIVNALPWFSLDYINAKTKGCETIYSCWVIFRSSCGETYRHFPSNCGDAADDDIDNIPLSIPSASHTPNQYLHTERIQFCLFHLTLNSICFFHANKNSNFRLKALTSVPPQLLI